MSSVCTEYTRRCDVCQRLHYGRFSSARRAIAAARRDGWQRRAIGLGNYSWEQSDVCADCLDKMESEGTA